MATDKECLELMIKNYTEMLHNFLAAVAALNQGNMRSVEELLDDNVVMHKIRDPLCCYSLRGKKAVIEALDAKTKGGRLEMKPMSPISVDIARGTVSGSAMWNDHAHGGDSEERIDYSFTLTQASDRRWRLQIMTASLAP